MTTRDPATMGARRVPLARYRPGLAGEAARTIHLLPLSVRPDLAGEVLAMCGARLDVTQIETVIPGQGALCLVVHLSDCPPPAPTTRKIPEQAPDGPGVGRLAAVAEYRTWGWPVTLRRDQIWLTLGADAVANEHVFQFGDGDGGVGGVDGGHSLRFGGGQVAGHIVDEHSVLARQAQPLQHQREDLRIRLAQPDLIGDHDSVVVLVEPEAGVGIKLCTAPTVGQHGNLDPAGPQLGDRCRHEWFRVQVADHPLQVHQDALGTLVQREDLLQGVRGESVAHTVEAQRTLE